MYWRDCGSQVWSARLARQCLRGRCGQPVGDLQLHGDQHQRGQDRPADGQLHRGRQGGRAAGSVPGEDSVTCIGVTAARRCGQPVLPGSVSEGGVGSQSVTYSYTVTNTSAARTDPLTVSSIVDDKVGELLAAFQAKTA